MDVNQVFKQYAQQLKRFFLSKVRNAADADDLVQEVMQKTFVRNASIQDPDKFRSWIFAVARNALIDHYRRSARYVNSELMSVAKELEDSQEVRLKLAKCIRPFLAQLPGEYRLVMEKVELQRTPQKQLAKDLEMSYSALKSRVQRARGMLRDLFLQCCQYQIDQNGGIMDFSVKDGDVCATCDPKLR